MATGLALAILFATTLISALTAGYYRLRMEAIQKKLFESDAMVELRRLQLEYVERELKRLKYQR